MHHWLMHNWYAVEEIPITGTHSDDGNRGFGDSTTRRAITRLVRELTPGAPLTQLSPAEIAGEGRHKHKKT